MPAGYDLNSLRQVGRECHHRDDFAKIRLGRNQCRRSYKNPTLLFILWSADQLLKVCRAVFFVFNHPSL